MQAVLHSLAEQWPIAVIYSLFAISRVPAARQQKRASLERCASDWPTIEGVASCRVWPESLSKFRVYVSATPSDGGAKAAWSRTYSTSDEARYYSRAIEGRTVSIRVDPYGEKGRLLLSSELEAMALPFVSETGGRLTPAGLRGAKVFRGAAVAGLGLTAANVALFAAKPDFEWHGMCPCEFSMVMLALGGLMLIPAAVLRGRMRALPEGNAGLLQGNAVRVMSLLLIGMMMAIVGALLIGSNVRGEVPDGVLFTVLTAPLFPLLWWSISMGFAAVRELRPLMPNDHAATREVAPGSRALEAQVTYR